MTKLATTALIALRDPKKQLALAKRHAPFKTELTKATHYKQTDSHSTKKAQPMTFKATHCEMHYKQTPNTSNNFETTLKSNIQETFPAFLAPVDKEAAKHFLKDGQQYWAYLVFGSDGGFYGSRRILEVLEKHSGLRELFMQSDDPKKYILGHTMTLLKEIRLLNPEMFDKFFIKFDPLTSLIADSMFTYKNYTTLKHAVKELNNRNGHLWLNILASEEPKDIKSIEQTINAFFDHLNKLYEKKCINKDTIIAIKPSTWITEEEFKSGHLPIKRIQKIASKLSQFHNTTGAKFIADAEPHKGDLYIQNLIFTIIELTELNNIFGWTLSSRFPEQAVELINNLLEKEMEHKCLIKIVAGAYGGKDLEIKQTTTHKETHEVYTILYEVCQLIQTDNKEDTYQKTRVKKLLEDIKSLTKKDVIK